ncbi:MAG: PAS domain S-box protein, partial [Methanoregula sp.]|nr:PAS domain S-box protein [Methanoregula sp.]
VTTATSAPEALRLLERERVDAIISDYQMPEMDGIEFLKVVRARGDQTPFIIFTGKGREEVVIEALNEGADGYLQESGEPGVQFAELSHKIKAAVSRKKAENALQRQTATLSILNDIISTANKADDLHELFESILAESLRLLDFDAGGIYLVDHSTRTANVVHSKNLPPGILAEIQTVPIDKKPYDTLFLNNEPIITENYEQIAEDRTKTFGIQSLASIPLISKGVAIGALNVASTKRHKVTPDEKQTLISISRELGSTIERLAAEEEVKKAAKNLETLFDSIDEMVFVLDMQGRILAVNDTVQKRLSYTAEELIGTDVLRLHVPERRDEALRNVQGMIAGTVDSCPVPVLAKDGTRIEVETKVTRGLWNGKEVLIGVTRDVTERKRAEEELRQSEILLRSMIESPQSVIIFSLDRNFRYLAFNATHKKTMKAIWGVDIRPGMNMLEVIGYERDRKNAEQNFLRALAGEHFTRTEEYGDEALGRKIWEDTYSPIYDETHQVIGLTVYVIDITERKRAEWELLQFSDRLSLATRAGGVGIWDYDVINNTLAWDDQMFALYGITREQFGGAYEAWQAGLHPEDRKRGDAEIQQALRGEKEFDTEFRVLWSDGTIHTLRALAIVQRDAEGIPLRMIGTNWDITVQKKAEEEIKRQAGLIKSLLDSIPDIIFFKDKEGVYLGCNPPFAEFVGKSREEIVGRTDYDLFDKEIADFFRGHDKRMLELGEPRHNEEWITYPDGRKILIDTLKTPYWGPDGTLIGVIGISRDITDRKRAEDAVLAANKKLNILNSVTRHDVLNQITALGMFLQIIEESTKDAELIEFARKAEGATERITRQIDFTREYQDIGVQAPQWQKVSDLIISAKSQLTACPYDLQVNTGAVEIYADPLLAKVFYNLLENAIRHGEHVSTVRFFCQKSEDDLTLVCEDNGIGIDAESKKHLFKQGFGKHTGFGLYLMREILSITGITITENGVPGKGARFEITVPKGMYRFTETGEK